MEVTQFVTSLLQAGEGFITRALEGFTPEDLKERPSQDTNPIGWLVWHLTRGRDASIASMAGTEQVYISGRWYERFGRDADPGDRGAGHTNEQVSAFDPQGVETLMGYFGAVKEVAVSYLAALTFDDMERQIPSPRGDGTVTLSSRLTGMVMDGTLHTGQVAYVRGLLKGKGWQPF